MKNKEFKTIYANVSNILFQNIEARDDNQKLIKEYLNNYHGIKDVICINDLFSNKIPKFDTITRFSRHIQLNFPLMRGKEWEKRQRKQVKVQSDLEYSVNN